MGHRGGSSSLCSYRSLSPKVPAHCPPLRLSPTIPPLISSTCPRFCPSCQNSWSWAACSISSIFFIAFLLIVFLLESDLTPTVARSHSFNMAALHNDFQGGLLWGFEGWCFGWLPLNIKTTCFLCLSIYSSEILDLNIYISIIWYKPSLWSYICGFFSALFGISA